MQRENDNSYAPNLCDGELQATSCVACHPATKKPVPGLLICRFGAALNYANAEAFMGGVLSVVNNLPTTPRWVVARFDSIADLDYFAAKTLTKPSDRMEAQGISLAFTELSKAVEDFLSEFGILTAFGTDRIFTSIEAAIIAYQGLTSEGPHGSAEPVTNRAPAYSKW